MNKIRLLSIGIIILLFLMTTGIAFAKTLNAWFLQFQERDNIIHLFIYDDHGQQGQPPAVVSLGQPIIIGYEWEEDTVEDIVNNVFNNRAHNITLSVNGSATVSLKSEYQTPFVAVPGSGPNWSWDHDGDGLGDGDGDGIGDWDNAVSFFRYEVAGLNVGKHSLLVTLTHNGVITVEPITVEVVP